MTTKNFCSENNTKATLTVDGYTYESDNPPLEVHFNSVFVTYRNQPTNMTFSDVFVGDYEIDELSLAIVSETTVRVENDNTPERKVYLVYINTLTVTLKSNGNVVRTKDLGDFFPGSLSSLNPYFKLYGISVLDKDLNLIYANESALSYSVKCDGCEPGECKGKKASYPGHVCLDCQKMNNSFNRMINKLR